MIQKHVLHWLRIFTASIETSKILVEVVILPISSKTANYNVKVIYMYIY